ncbi:MAG: OmpA family protein [Bacteroidales bacterium]|nr:OmpA family protein [Bacteroidales bacterium]MCM1146745.1 OmpA family protein [Bacteroidales bacterium]MCM1205562.1 OmpA family protein [Bacillota bacterium]MCM1509176.1 OmpA family protein [Clostridium sp.]
MKNRPYIVLFSLLLFISCGIDNNIKKGEAYLALGEYYDAGEQFKKAYSKTPAKEREKRGMLALKTARCYERINASQKAVGAYRNAVRYNTATIDDRLSLGRQMLKIGDYKNAAAELQMVLDSMPDNILAKNGLTSAKMAPQWKKEGSRYTIKKQDIFNSRRADFSPMLAGDQHDLLYFTSTRNDAEGDELSGITGTKAGDIFVSQKDDKGKWSRPEAVTGGINTEYDEGTCSFSPDGREMYITQCLNDGEYPRYAQIAKSNRSDAAWGKATVAELTKDTLSSFAHPAISPDGNWLYFVSDMPGGQGGLDIWRARITATGFGGVENLGPQINTPGNEMFPTFRPNGDFYFSSDGLPGMGGLDIYYATTDSNGKLKIEHPGYPLNSNGDDFGMTFEGLQNKGFFSSNRADLGHGWDKIYSFENPEIIQTVKGWVYENDGYELPKALVYMVGNDGTNLKLSVKGDGSFEQKINPDVDYIFLATCPGFLNHKEELRVQKAEESEEYTLQFPLPNIGIPTLINNINYEFDKATLTSESTEALDKLADLLNENPNITIELSAHCDYRGSAAYNKTLSQKRAEAVCSYLKSKGIAEDRLTPRGYGKEKPKTIRKKLTETYTWLKENDQLTQEFIENLPKEQQEIANQLNRRTEFVVLRTTYGMFDEKGNLKPLPKKQKKEDGGADTEFFDIE